MASRLAVNTLTRAEAPRVFAGARTAAIRQHPAFSTTRQMLNGKPAAEASSNPELPKFSLKHLSSNPRTRFWIGASIFVLGCIEGAAWFKFWPKIMGKEEKVVKE